MTIEKIPDNVFVHCPMKEFILTRATNCADCEHNQGLMQMQDAGEFVQKYRVFCGHPIARRLEVIEL